MKVFLAQINPTVGAIGHNLDLIVQAIDEAKPSADLIVFPQLALSGAPLHDLLFHRDLVEECERALQTIAAASVGITVIVGSPATDGRSVFDAAIIFDNGHEIGRQHDTSWQYTAHGKRLAVAVGEQLLDELDADVDMDSHKRARESNAANARLSSPTNGRTATRSVRCWP